MSNIEINIPKLHINNKNSSKTPINLTNTDIVKTKMAKVQINRASTQHYIENNIHPKIHKTKISLSTPPYNIGTDYRKE